MRPAVSRPVGFLLAVLAFLTFTSASGAETIHGPAPAAVVREDQGQVFDWAWDSDQYASYLYFAQTADPQDPIWFGPNPTDRPRIRISDNYQPLLSSNAYVVPKANSITPGVWHWRICSFTVGGEDDKCYFRMAPRPITITAAPAPPPIAPTPAPAPPQAPTAPAAPVLPITPVDTTTPFSVAYATSVAKADIKLAFKYKRTPARRRVSCVRSATPLTHRCKASWETKVHTFRGTILVSPDPITAADRERQGDVFDDEDSFYTMNLVRTTKGTGAKKTIKLR